MSFESMIIVERGRMGDKFLKMMRPVHFERHWLTSPRKEILKDFLNKMCKIKKIKKGLKKHKLECIDDTIHTYECPFQVLSCAKQQRNRPTL